VDIEPGELGRRRFAQNGVMCPMVCPIIGQTKSSFGTDTLENGLGSARHLKKLPPIYTEFSFRTSAGLRVYRPGFSQEDGTDVKAF
jgi:hypothetical protein